MCLLVQNIVEKTMHLQAQTSEISYQVASYFSVMAQSLYLIIIDIHTYCTSFLRKCVPILCWSPWFWKRPCPCSYFRLVSWGDRAAVANIGQSISWECRKTTGATFSGTVYLVYSLNSAVKLESSRCSQSTDPTSLKNTDLFQLILSFE